MRRLLYKYDKKMEQLNLLTLQKYDIRLYIRLVHVFSQSIDVCNDKVYANSLILNDCSKARHYRWKD